MYKYNCELTGKILNFPRQIVVEWRREGVFLDEVTCFLSDRSDGDIYRPNDTVSGSSHAVYNRNRQEPHSRGVF